MGTSFVYIKSIRAPLPSELRRAAYAENGQLAGPDADPEGWKVLPAVKVAGTLFETRSIDLDCTVRQFCSLYFVTNADEPAGRNWETSEPAFPSRSACTQSNHLHELTYALNSPIPLWITITSSDAQGLDLLATPSALQFILRRSLAVGDDAVDDKREERGDGTTFPQESTQAAIWPLQEQLNNAESKETVKDRLRILEGELYVASNLKPSFTFPRVSVRVSATAEIPRKVIIAVIYPVLYRLPSSQGSWFCSKSSRQR